MIKCIIKTRDEPEGIDVQSFGFCLMERPEIVVADYKVRTHDFFRRDGQIIHRGGLEDKEMRFIFNALENHNIKPKLRKIVALFMDATEIELSEENLVYTVKNVNIGDIENEVEEYAMFEVIFTVKGYETSKHTVRKNIFGLSETLQNNGTYKAWPKFRVKFYDDCGYIDFMTPQGHMLIGNPDQVDKVYVGNSDYAMNEEMHETKTWNRGNPDLSYFFHSEYDEHLKDLTASYSHDQYGIIFNPIDRVSNLQDKIKYGVFLYKEFEPDAAGERTAENWDLTFRFNLAADSRRYGEVSIGVLDENHIPIVFIHTVGSHIVNNAIISRYMYSDDNNHKVKVRNLRNHAFTSRTFHGDATITKRGSQFYYGVNNKEDKLNPFGYYQLNSPALAQRKAKYAFVYMGQTKHLEPPTKMGVQAVIVKRKHSSDMRDIRNTFMRGDILRIDHQTGELLLNDLPYREGLDPGSKFWTIPPGGTELAIEYSDWYKGQRPDISVEYKEHWR